MGHHAKNKNAIAFGKFLTSALALGLSACGGGGGGGGDAASTTSVSVTVVDGPLQNTLVFLDKNGNGTLDPGEPTAATDANGHATLTVAAADAGKFPIVAMVTPQSTDADTGPVTGSYAMKAPADASAVISPLTTLVQTQIETFGTTTAQALASVAATTGLTASQITSDYTKDSSAAGTAAYTVAQAAVLAAQKQVSNGLLAVNTLAIDGTTVIATKDLYTAVQTSVAQMLPAIASSALTSSTVTNATTPTARLAALQNVITPTFLAANGGITSVAGAQVVVGVNNLATSQASTVPPTYTPAATASLANLSYTDASHWYARISQKTLAEATLDSSNTYQYRWAHYRNDGAGPLAWGAMGSTPQRGADLHWNGSAWVGCAANFQNRQTAVGANGMASYNYCDGFENGTVNSKSPTSAVIDVGGQSMSSVYSGKILAANLNNIKIGDGTVTSANALLGSATFPTGSKLTFVTDIATAYAPAYFPSSGNPGNDNTVLLSSAIDAAGGDFTTGSTQTACLNSTASYAPATRLEDLIAVNPGTPCKYAATAVVGLGGTTVSSSEGGQTRNEAWGLTTLSLGTLGSAFIPGSAASATTFYTGNTPLRVAFAANNVAKYYACQQSYSGGTRNCNLLGSGTYSISTLGDGSRTLNFSGMPPVAATLGWSRVYIERNGLIYYGYQNLPATYLTARLNKVAMDALLAQLGLNTVSYFNGLAGGFDPASTVSFNQLAYAGTYMGAIQASGYSAGDFTVSRNTNGTNSCSGHKVYASPSTSGSSFTCTATITPTGSDGSTATITITTAGGLAFTGALSYYTGVISGGTWTASSGTPASGTFSGSRI